MDDVTEELDSTQIEGLSAVGLLHLIIKLLRSIHQSLKALHRKADITLDQSAQLGAAQSAEASSLQKFITDSVTAANDIQAELAKLAATNPSVDLTAAIAASTTMQQSIASADAALQPALQAATPAPAPAPAAGTGATGSGSTGTAATGSPVPPNLPQP